MAHDGDAFGHEITYAVTFALESLEATDAKGMPSMVWKGILFEQ